MDVAHLAWEVYRRYLSGQSYRQIGQDLGIGKSMVPDYVRRVTEGEFGEPPDSDPDRIRGLAKTLDRNGWSIDQVLAWTALFEAAEADGLDPQALASVTGALARAAEGVCDPAHWLSMAAKLARAEEAGNIPYDKVLDDFEAKRQAIRNAEQELAKLGRQGGNLRSRLHKMRKERQELAELLADTKNELAVAQARASDARNEANSAENKSKALESRIRSQVEDEARVKRENRLLKQEKERLIADVKRLQALREVVQEGLEAEDTLLAQATSMQRDAELAVAEHRVEIGMAKDLARLITQGELNPYGRLFHELYLAMKQADGTITPLESLGVSEGAKERIKQALLEVLEENEKLPHEAKDLLLRYTLAKKVVEGVGES